VETEAKFQLVAGSMKNAVRKGEDQLWSFGTQGDWGDRPRQKTTGSIILRKKKGKERDGRNCRKGVPTSKEEEKNERTRYRTTAEGIKRGGKG